MALTFESGLDSLMHFVGLKGEEAYHANAADPCTLPFVLKQLFTPDRWVCR